MANVRFIDPSNPKPEDLPFINEIIKKHANQPIIHTQVYSEEEEPKPYQINGQLVELAYPLLNFSGDFWVKNPKENSTKLGSVSQVYELNAVYKKNQSNYAFEQSETLIKQRTYNRRQLMGTIYFDRDNFFGLIQREAKMLKLAGDPQADLLLPENSQTSYQKLSKAKGIPLDDYFLANPNLNFQERLAIIKLIHHEVKKLHENGIAHLDLKPDNIFYDANSKKITLIDFDSALELNTPMDKAMSVTDNLVTPPDKSKGTAKEVDYFSLAGIYGMVLSDWRKLSEMKQEKKIETNWSHLPLIKKPDKSDVSFYNFETAFDKKNRHPKLMEFEKPTDILLNGIFGLADKNYQTRQNLKDFDTFLKQTDQAIFEKIISTPIKNLDKQQQQELARSLENFMNDAAIQKSAKHELVHLKLVYHALSKPDSPHQTLDQYKYLEQEDSNLKQLLIRVIKETEEKQRHHIGSSNVAKALKEKISSNIIDKLPSETREAMNKAKQNVAGRASALFAEKMKSAKEKTSRFSRHSKESSEPAQNKWVSAKPRSVK